MFRMNAISHPPTPIPLFSYMHNCLPFPHTTHRRSSTAASPSATVSDAPHTGWEQGSSPLSPDLPERSLGARRHQSGNHIYPKTNISNPFLIGKLDNQLLNQGGEGTCDHLSYSASVVLASFLLPRCLEVGLVQCLLMIDGLHCCEGFV